MRKLRIPFKLLFHATSWESPCSATSGSGWLRSRAAIVSAVFVPAVSVVQQCWPCRLRSDSRVSRVRPPSKKHFVFFQAYICKPMAAPMPVDSCQPCPCQPCRPRVVLCESVSCRVANVRFTFSVPCRNHPERFLRSSTLEMQFLPEFCTNGAQNDVC